MLHLTIVTPSKKLLVDQPVESLFAPAENGEINILPGHAPLLSTLSTGVLKYKTAESTKLEQVVLSWGFCEVANDKVTILAETAEREEEIDKERARQALKTAQDRLNAAGLGESELEKYRRKLERAEARLNLNH